MAKNPLQQPFGNLICIYVMEFGCEHCKISHLQIHENFLNFTRKLKSCDTCNCKLSRHLAVRLDKRHLIDALTIELFIFILSF